MILLKNYSKSIYVARGHTSPYKRQFKGLGFRWSKRLKGGPAYTIKVYSMKHINTVFEKLKHIVRSNNADDDVCLVHSEKFKKRLASTYNPEDQVYPNKKVCEKVCDEISEKSEIDSFKEAIYLAVTSFPLQLVLFSLYFNYFYPHNDGIYTSSTEFAPQAISLNVTDMMFDLQDKFGVCYANISDLFYT